MRSGVPRYGPPRRSAPTSPINSACNLESPDREPLSLLRVLRDPQLQMGLSKALQMLSLPQFRDAQSKATAGKTLAL
jgi:hypothetical protein